MPPEPTTEGAPDTPTPLSEIKLLGQIANRVERLSPAGRSWLKAWLGELE